MGKKSKASKAKAKAKGKTAPAPSANGHVPNGGNAGIVSDASGAMVTGKKANKCVRCFGTVKAEKGISCPGCSQLYCWRCEKKAFGTCPNGDKCVHPIRRCKRCSAGKTFLDTMKRREELICPEPNTEDPTYFRSVGVALQRFNEDVIAEDDVLTIDASPVVICTSCGVHECRRCFLDPKPGKIDGCGICTGHLCGACSEEMLQNTIRAISGDDASARAIANRCIQSRLENGSPSPEYVQEFGEVLCRVSGDAIIRCHTPGCKLTACVSCLDDLSLASVVKSVLSYDQERGRNLLPFKCSRCYWSTKPCTNPSCPNEVGVPTKRCGGCHIDRYCSVECQAAAYPAHMNRCSKIQEKRKASLGDKGGQDE